MHHIYHTSGFILSSRNVGEANKIFTIYTRELGLVRAVCQGIRLHKSKNRFALQDFSLSSIDLVRGRDVWRITSAENKTSFPYIRSDKSSLFLMSRISSLLDRLCKGEESSFKIFDDFIESLFILDDVSINKEKREALELHLVLNIMSSLGYIGDNQLISKHLSLPFIESNIEDLLKEKQLIISHINKAITESHL